MGGNPQKVRTMGCRTNGDFFRNIERSDQWRVGQRYDMAPPFSPPILLGGGWLSIRAAITTCMCSAEYDKPCAPQFSCETCSDQLHAFQRFRTSAGTCLILAKRVHFVSRTRSANMQMRGAHLHVSRTRACVGDHRLNDRVNHSFGIREMSI